MNKRAKTYFLWAWIGAVIGFSFSGVFASSPAAIRFQLAASHVAAPQLLSVRLVPEDMTLWGRNASRRFLVLGRYSDGLEREITAQSRLSLSDSEVAKVEEPAAFGPSRMARPH